MHEGLKKPIDMSYLNVMEIYDCNAKVKTLDFTGHLNNDNKNYTNYRQLTIKVFKVLPQDSPPA